VSFIICVALCCVLFEHGVLFCVICVFFVCCVLFEHGVLFCVICVFLCVVSYCNNRLYCLEVRVPGYRSRGMASIPY
jgi:hypothetical protein